jgi:hypothetical protein
VDAIVEWLCRGTLAGVLATVVAHATVAPPLG